MTLNSVYTKIRTPSSKISIVTTTAVQARVIPFHKVDAIVSLLPKEMRGILQTIIKRTLALS
jgi:hypothetical protein